MALRGDELFLSYGVMGGFMQVCPRTEPISCFHTAAADECMTKPQGHVQVLLNILRGYGVQAALDAPRFCISAGSPETESNQTGQSGDINSEVYFEEGIAEEVIEKLRRTSLESLSSPGGPK